MRPVREGAEIVDAAGAVIGVVTSGGFGPSVNAPVAMGYVDAAHAAAGTALKLRTRRGDEPATVVAPPLRPAPLRPYKELIAMASRLLFTKDHEWVKADGDTATIGITSYAADQLGDVVFVELPEAGRSVKKGEAAAVVELVKAASDVYMPVSGEVIEANGALTDDPQTVNEAPRGRRLVREDQAFRPERAGRRCWTRAPTRLRRVRSEHGA